MKIEEKTIDLKFNNLNEKSDELSKQNEVYQSMKEAIDEERIKLQTMAEKLSQLSHDLMIKAQIADEKLARIDRVNSCMEHTKTMILNEQTNLKNDRYSIISNVEEINLMKMDIARQRVEYLKEKFK